MIIARRPARFVLVALIASSPVAVGCAAPTERDESVGTSEADVIGRVQGNTLGSAYAKPNATYLSKRNIELLREVGALSDAVGTLAARVDGIIANQPPDGRVSVQELVKMEQPGFVETLFPEEKAALPKLWALLETTASAPKNPAPLAALPAIAPQDLSTPAGTLSMPSVLQIADLPEPLKLAARRIQLTHDVDNSDDTITLADVNGALQNTAPYTPEEVQKFHQIIDVFKAQAKSSIASRVNMPAPFATSKTLSAIGTNAKLKVEDALVLRETRHLWHSNPNYAEGRLSVNIQARLSRKLSVEAAPNEKVIAIFEDTEHETLLEGPIDTIDAGVATFEVWSNGQRTTIRRVKFTAALAPKDDQVDLSSWADYAMTAGSAPLFKNVLKASTQGVYNAGTSWSAEYEYGTTATPAPANADATALHRLTTPTSVVPGRYEVDTGAAGKVRIDVSPTGVVFVTRLATGASLKTYVHTWSDGPKHHAHFPDRFRVLLNGNTSQLTIFFDGQGKLFEGTLRASDRTG